MSERTLFPDLPAEARLWIYPVDRMLDEDEQAALQEDLQAMLAGWTSHSRPVQGHVTVEAGRFLLLGAYLPNGGDISGCGIDASVHAVEAVAERQGVGLLSPLLVFYRDAEGLVQAVGRPSFRRLVRAGEVTAETRVFDLSITTVGELRAGRFERPAAESWHGRVFALHADVEAR